MKRVLTIQDLSCIGKCSLSVALPVISAMGIETAVIPTAVLSNHTAFKNGFTYCDMTKNLSDVLNQWKRDNYTFDAIYTGYIGSVEEIDVIKKLIDSFPRSLLKIVDPAMADNGSLYKGLTVEYAKIMTDLCMSADVIVPNLSEACIMTGRKYRDDIGREQITEIMKELSDSGPSTVVLTSVKNRDGHIGVIAYDRNCDCWYEKYNEHIPGTFHGTGDVFASCLSGMLAKGFTLDKAVEVSADFVFDSLKRTQKDPDSVWYGINFEEEIPGLSQKIKEMI